jgi:ABC-type proline/glycine betaine transport system ATPase subunit
MCCANGTEAACARQKFYFALFSWLTVLQNVEAGLEALAVPTGESRRRALSAISSHSQHAAPQ